MFSFQVVQKDALARDTIVSMLEMLGHAAVGAESFEAALENAQGVAYDAVLFTLRYDDPDGATFAARIKAISPRTKAIVISGWILSPKLSPVIDGFISKPFDIPELDRKIEGILIRRGPDAV